MTSTSAAPKPQPRQKRSVTKRIPSSTPKLDSAQFLERAQQIVVNGFNAHRQADKTPELLLTEVHVVWFAKVLGGWKCMISSTAARGMYWEVTYASFKDEIYLDVYQKVSNDRLDITGKKIITEKPDVPREKVA